jgi:peptidoglycan/xylan/chitin deacetylase (PgdA/CDA1 family)
LLQDDANRRRFQLLTKSGIAELLQPGMALGAHTLHHPVLAECSAEVAQKEVAVFESASGYPLWAFAYPFGTNDAVSGRELALTEAAGYECAFMNVGAGFSSTMNKFSIQRVHITADMNLGEFEAHMAAFHQYFQSKLHHSPALTLHEPALQQR